MRITGHCRALGFADSKPPVTPASLRPRLAEQQIELRLPQRFHLGYLPRTLRPPFVKVAHQLAGARVVD